MGEAEEWLRKAITPSPGSLQVNLDVMGPFGIDVDGSKYRSVNCSSSCKVSLPYVGEIFNGCTIESEDRSQMKRCSSANTKNVYPAPELFTDG